MEATRVNYWLLVIGGLFWTLQGSYYVIVAGHGPMVAGVELDPIVGIAEIAFGVLWLRTAYRSDGHVSFRSSGRSGSRSRK